MSRDQQKFQKAFLHQMKATFRGNFGEASKTRNLVNFYRRKLEDKN